MRQIENEDEFFVDFYNTVRLNSNKIAVRDSKNVITYKELNEKSTRIAEILLSTGVDQEEIIAIVCDRNISIVLSILAILKSGCAFVPINPLTPKARISYMLSDCNVRFALIDNCERNKILSDEIITYSTNDEYPNYQTPLPKCDNNQLAYVLYTSGSTGLPKGVLIERGSLYNVFISLIEEIGFINEDKFVAVTDFMFDISLIEILLPLLIGAEVVIAEQGSIADGYKIKNLLSHHNITVMQATPITWEILIKHGWINDGSVKILVGGEKFTKDLENQLNIYFKNVWNLFGPTETTIWSMIYRITEPTDKATVQLGKPLKNTQIYILDGYLNNVEDEQQGQLYIGGLGLARSYLNNSALTSEKFIYHPVHRTRLFNTGDLVYRNNKSEIFFIGRTDKQIKIAGVRIEPQEIESAINKAPCILKTVVKAHEATGYCKALIAYIEINEDIAFRRYHHRADQVVISNLEKAYEYTYKDAHKLDDSQVSTCGWISSYTGKEITEYEISQSYEQLTNLMKGIDLSDVFEVGCGLGELYFHLSHIIKQYTALEMSQTALDCFGQRLLKKNLKGILVHSSIDKYHFKRKHQCIIANSVVQYFPSLEYLLDVLNKLINATKDGGALVIGDVRCKELVEFFYLEKISSKIKPPIHTFYQKSIDDEISLSPLFFYALKELRSEISWIDINVKNGDANNEINHYRYDVVLHINKEVTIVNSIELDYCNEISNRNLWDLINETNKPVIINKIPNIWVDKKLNYLSTIFPQQIREIFSGEVRSNTINYELIHNLTLFRAKGKKVTLTYDLKCPMNYLVLSYYPENSDSILTRSAGLPIKYEKLEKYCRQPFNPVIQSMVIEEAKIIANNEMLQCIKPSTYIWLERWPVSVSNKVDIQKLNNTKEVRLLEMSDPIEQDLQAIWREMTGLSITNRTQLDQLGVSSLYGHYILATINEKYKIEMEYKTFLKFKELKELVYFIKESMPHTESLQRSGNWQ